MGVRWWIGNHGSDPGRRDPRESRWQNDVANWRSCLTAELRIEDGFEVEDKGHSLSVHYRRASDPAAAELQVRRSAAKLPRCRRVGGKFVVNLVPDSAPDKGTALLDLMRESRSRVAFFIGDDVTDEDAFRARRRHPGVIGIRIGHSQDTDARFAIPDQRSIDRLLELILELV
jgi:trehalose 6-phosphate phosphatase